MGCKAITPHLVSLAKKLEGRPFHLVATHCQRNSKEQVVAYLKSQKLEADQSNFSVTSFGGHPQVKGNGYVPYYMVFDHHGKLAHHHMCGAYHGGDGLEMIKWVEKLLADTPEIYLGKEPFERHADLANQISGKKRLAASIKKLESALEADPQDAELLRLKGAMTAYSDRRISSAKRCLSTEPSRVLPQLGELKKEFRGTSLAAPVDEAIAELKGSPVLKSSIAVGKSLAKLRKRMAGLKSCRACKRQGLKSARLDCGGCRQQNGKAIDKTRKALGKLLKQHPDLPIAKSVKAFLAELE